jgi:hypothetical protein
MIGVAFAALVSLSSDLSERLYLTCQVSDPPHVKIADIYRTPPSDEEAMARDILQAGEVSLMTPPPPETWELDPYVRTIKAGPGGWQWLFNNADFDPSEISGTITPQAGRYIMVRFNRISGTAETTFVIPQRASDAWRQVHGKPLPLTWSWTQTCTASGARAF